MLALEKDREREIRDEVDRRFNADFNFIRQENLQKICEYWYEYVSHPDMDDITEEIDAKIEKLQEQKQEIEAVIDELEREDELSTEKDKQLEDSYDLLDKIDNAISDLEEEVENEKERVYENIYEIMWSTLFEAKDGFLAEKIRENVSELYDLGLTVIDLGNSDYADAYDTGVFIGVRGCGYDFYDAHWIPMYRDIFHWVK